MRPDRSDPLRYATVPLRLFLGVTFIYAGLQKFSDPGFLSPGSSTFIGTQLQGYAGHSPIGFLLTAVAIPLAVPVGLTVMLGEIAIGLMTVLGIFTRWAALLGAMLSAVLFLTASWSVQPYFLGSDSIYTVAWLTIALAGDLGVLTLQRRPLSGRQGVPIDLARRRFLLQLGGASVAAVWLLALLPRGRPSAAGSGQVAVPSAQPTPSLGGSPSASSPASSPPAGAKLIGSLDQIRSGGGSLDYQDPKSGDAAVLVDLGGNQVVAYDAVCTHAGCTVQYQANDRQLVCPCHGAAFDAAHGGQVLGGPAPTPLTKLQITVQPNGDVYAQ
ncbi:MAG: TQO small subunit DoxD [Candidatus Dormibacter sp.]|uniref:TQO small subunit DoxD n=1 Tax=Candidatus Dormibacter sp. TaxID=2973982 RepID=UPI003D9B27D3